MVGWPDGVPSDPVMLAAYDLYLDTKDMRSFVSALLALSEQPLRRDDDQYDDEDESDTPAASVSGMASTASASVSGGNGWPSGRLSGLSEADARAVMEIYRQPVLVEIVQRMYNPPAPLRPILSQAAALRLLELINTQGVALARYHFVLFCFVFLD